MSKSILFYEQGPEPGLIFQSQPTAENFKTINTIKSINIGGIFFSRVPPEY